MIHAVDTLWITFSNNLANINPQRVAVGYMDAQDWPPQKVQFNAFYLLELAADPLGKSADSWAVPFYVHTLQFVWIVKGTDVSNYNNVLGKTRGDRVRINANMKEELLKSLYPGFTQKLDVSVGANQQLSIKTLNEPLVWSKPAFRIRADRDSGLVYGTASVRMTDMTADIGMTPETYVMLPTVLAGLNPDQVWQPLQLNDEQELEVG